jgi:hypothetical protein
MKRIFAWFVVFLLPCALFAQSYSLGDVNHDGNIEIVDSLLIAQSYVGLNPTPFYPSEADVNCSGEIDIVDALLIAQYYVSLISQFPCPIATPVVTLTPTDTPTDAPTSAPTSAPACVVPAMPAFSSLQSNAKLPDPFKFMDGTRMTRKDQWDCRKAEISALAQTFEYGTKPPKPSTVTGSYSSGNITVTCTDSGKTISFSCKITLPSKGTAPYPAMITIGGSFLNNTTLSNLGVALIDLPNTDIAVEGGSSTRGQGKFYTLYGSGHSAGAIMAYAWGCSRLIDALETTPAAGIDPKRIGVTGCSLNGKGALGCGAFENRIVLTIPQESGSGGAGSWRVAQASSGVQPLSQAVQENCWFTNSFSQFGSQVDKLPIDHHEIIGLCAPNAVLVIENTVYVWLGNVSTWTDGNAAHMVWEALGIPDRMGFSQVGHSDHCGLPGSQDAIISTFVQKFLVGGGTGNTNIMQTDGGLTFDKAKWIDWTVPALQ